MPSSSSDGSSRSASVQVLESDRHSDQTAARRPVGIFHWRRAFSFPLFLAAAIVGGAFIVAGTDAVALGKIFTEGDTWWHLASGQQILATRSFPLHDTYSYTASGTDWIAYGWLWEILMAAAEHRAHLQGLGGLLLFSSALLFLLLYYYAWLRSRNAKAAMIACAASLPIAGPFISLRPQVLGAICFVLVMICIEFFRQGKSRALFFLPLIFAVWVNTHGSFVLGLGVLGFYWIIDLLPIRTERLLVQPWTPMQRRQLAATILACVLALCISPYGTRLAAYPFEFSALQGQIKDTVIEWEPLNLGQTYGQIFIAIILIILALQTLRPVKYRVGELGFFLFAAFFTCLHERFLLIFAFAALPIVTVAVAPYVPPYETAKDKPLLNAALIVLILAALVGMFPSEENLQAALARKYPVEAVHYLKQNPPTHIWNEDTWGGYLIYSSKGALKPFLDGRFDIYAYAGVLSDYISIAEIRPELPVVLRRYNIDTVLVHRNAPVGVYLAALPGWQRVYQDHTAEVYRRHYSPSASGR